MRRSLTRLVLAVLPLGLFGAHLSGSRVAPMAQRSSVHSQQLQFISVSFADSRNGWVAAFTPDQNYTLHTTNSGHTWARYPVAFEARQMQFIDARRGWAIGFAPRNCSGPRTPCGGRDRSYARWRAKLGLARKISSLLAANVSRFRQ